MHTVKSNSIGSFCEHIKYFKQKYEIRLTIKMCGAKIQLSNEHNKYIKLIYEIIEV